jgi:hypothetical protein
MTTAGPSTDATVPSWLLPGEIQGVVALEDLVEKFVGTVRDTMHV